MLCTHNSELKEPAMTSLNFYVCNSHMYDMYMKGSLRTYLRSLTYSLIHSFRYITHCTLLILTQQTNKVQLYFFIIQFTFYDSDAQIQLVTQGCINCEVSHLSQLNKIVPKLFVFEKCFPKLKLLKE